MKMKRIAFPIIAVFAAASVATVAGWLALDNQASAQPDVLSPANVQVVNGDDACQVIVSWDAVAGASGYSVRWVDVNAALDGYNAGGSWQNLIQSVDVAESGATSYTQTIDGLSPGTQYAFSVGSRSGSAQEPAWSDWKHLTPQGEPDCADAYGVDVQDVVQLQAAALALVENANALVSVGSVPTNAAMTRVSIGQDMAAVDRHKAALLAEVAILKQSGPEDRVAYIESLVSRLTTNVDAIQQGRGPLLLAFQAESASILRLTQSSNRDLFPKISTSVDLQFYQLLSKISDGKASASGSPTTEEVLGYTHTTDLSAGVELGQTLLLVASGLRNPAYVARTEEAFDEMAGRVDRNVAYLRENPVAGLDEEVLNLAVNMRDAGGGEGQVDYFVRLSKHLELRAMESERIEDNADILNRLLEQANVLSKEVRGLDAPAVPTMAVSDTTDPGITDDAIRFGQSAALSGPSEALGKGMRLGIQAAFKEANDAGGVHGRQLMLTTHDDGYEPNAAFANTLRLIERDEVFGLIGAVGTPTTRAALPLAEAGDVPFIGAFTGAQLLRGAEQDNVLNVRASYHDETEKMVAYLEEMGKTRVAVLYQNDSYGQDGLAGVQKALDQRDGMELAASWYYKRNTSAVQSAAFRISEAEPEAVIIIGAYQPAAAAIKKLRMRLEPDTIFMNVSFVGSNALASELGDAGEGVYVTQVVPLPSDASHDAVAAYRAALSAYDSDAEPGFISLEGYLAGRLAIARLQDCGPDVNRECFLDVFGETTPVDISGLALEFGPMDNQGSDDVYLTVIDSDGEYVPADSIQR